MMKCSSFLEKVRGGEQVPEHHKLDLYKLLNQAPNLVHKHLDSVLYHHSMRRCF